MKTLSVTEGRQNLGAWLKRALRGEDVGFVVDGRIVFFAEKGILTAYDVMTHDEIKAWLRSF